MFRVRRDAKLFTSGRIAIQRQKPATASCTNSRNDHAALMFGRIGQPNDADSSLQVIALTLPHQQCGHARTEPRYNRYTSYVQSQRGSHVTLGVPSSTPVIRSVTFSGAGARCVYAKPADYLQNETISRIGAAPTPFLQKASKPACMPLLRTSGSAIEVSAIR
jgi:hypothetical protein